MNARHECSTAEDTNLAVVEALIYLVGNVMPRCSDGVHESPFAVSIIVVRVGKNRRRSRFAVLLNAIMAEVEARLTQFLAQSNANFVISSAAIKADFTLLIGQLRSIDERHNTGASDVFLVCLLSFGKARQYVRCERLTSKALQLFLESQLARLKTTVASLLAQAFTESFGLEINMTINAVNEATPYSTDANYHRS